MHLRKAQIIFILDQIYLRFTRKCPLALFQGKNIFSCAFKCKDDLNYLGYLGSYHHIIKTIVSTLRYSRQRQGFLHPVRLRISKSSISFKTLCSFSSWLRKEIKKGKDISTVKAPVLIYIYTSRHFVFVEINVFRVCILLSHVCHVIVETKTPLGFAADGVKNLKKISN